MICERACRIHALQPTQTGSVSAYIFRLLHYDIMMEHSVLYSHIDKHKANSQNPKYRLSALNDHCIHENHRRTFGVPQILHKPPEQKHHRELQEFYFWILALDL